LKNGGSIGAIFPWAFLQADYAQPVRKLLAEKFESIEYSALSGKYFEDAQERVVLVWLKNYGNPCNSINFFAGKEITHTSNM
jgi:hypothetical protein